MLSKKKALTASLLCAVASVGFVADVQAEKSMNHELNEIVIEGEKDLLPGGFVSQKSTLGLLGDKDIMDTPFSQVNLSSKTIEKFGGPNQPLQNVLVNNPAVRVEGTTLHNDISIRGLKSTGTSYYLNGIPGMMTQFNAPTFAISDIQFISGPNSGLTGVPCTYETSTAGGIVNFVTKKAGKVPVTSYKQVFTGKDSLGEYFDIGRRFGHDDTWGVRINTEYLNGETAIDNHEIESQGISANIDYTTEKHTTNIATGYRKHNVKGGMRWFGFSNVGKADAKGNIVTKLPDAPDADKDLGFDGMEKEAEGAFITLNHEHEFADGWKWFANAGLNDNKLNKNITGKGSRFSIINDKGDIGPASSKWNTIFSTSTHTENRFAQVGMHGELKTGNIDHNLSMALEKAWYKSSGAKDYFIGQMGNASGNIYEGIHVEGFWKPDLAEVLKNKNFYWGASIADTMVMGKAQVMVGVHKHENVSRSFNKNTGAVTSEIKSSAVCPTYGVVYRPDEHISLYGSHSENFDKGEIVGSKYENEGDILDPAKTKQNEIGIKYTNKGIMTSLGIFEITQANNFEVKKGEDLYYLQDGEQEYKGVELSVNGKFAPKWSFMGGLMYLDAEQNKTQNGLRDGMVVGGVSDWNAVATLEYEANEDFSVIGRVLYNASSKICDEQLTVPSYTTYDLGVNYRTELFHMPVSLTAMCYNVTDKNFWTSHGSGVLLNNPRTFMVSASFDI